MDKLDRIEVIKQKLDRIEGIKQRILAEYRKHGDLDWAEIAAIKINKSYCEKEPSSFKV
ncbi:MAG: hypothetical protein ACOCVF_02005 [bacterium]